MKCPEPGEKIRRDDDQDLDQDLGPKGVASLRGEGAVPGQHGDCRRSDRDLLPLPVGHLGVPPRLLGRIVPVHQDEEVGLRLKTRARVDAAANVDRHVRAGPGAGAHALELEDAPVHGRRSGKRFDGRGRTGCPGVGGAVVI